MLLIQIPDELEAPLQDYCREDDTTPTELISELLTGLLLGSSDYVIEELGISLDDLVNAFCLVLDGTQLHELESQGFTPDQVELISRVRAGVHDIWMDGKLT